MKIVDNSFASPARRVLLFLFLSAALFLQPGCFNPLQSRKPNVQLGNSKTHFVQGEPVISISPLVNRKDEFLGAIVRVGSYDDAVKEMQSANSPNPNGTTAPRTKMMVDSSGITLLADQRVVVFDEATLLGGPWIYYLNEAEPFRRIPVNVAQIKQFEAALQNQGPVEFVAQWCDKQPGLPIGGLTQEEYLAKIKSR